MEKKAKTQYDVKAIIILMFLLQAIGILLCIMGAGCTNTNANINTEKNGTLTIGTHNHGLPTPIIVNETNYRLLIDIEGFGATINLNKEKIIIQYPKQTQSIRLKITAWDKNDFPVGSAHKIIPFYTNEQNNPMYIWKVRKTDLEY